MIKNFVQPPTSLSKYHHEIIMYNLNNYNKQTFNFYLKNRNQLTNIHRIINSINHSKLVLPFAVNLVIFELCNKMSFTDSAPCTPSLFSDKSFRNQFKQSRSLTYFKMKTFTEAELKYSQTLIGPRLNTVNSLHCEHSLDCKLVSLIARVCISKSISVKRL